MKTVYMIALRSGTYLGADGYETNNFSHAQRFARRKDAKAEYGKLLGWPKAIVVKVEVSKEES
jgi:hypothetical protein